MKKIICALLLSFTVILSSISVYADNQVHKIYNTDVQNIINNGIVYIKNNYIYYSSKGSNEKGRLIKVKKDGTNDIKLDDGIIKNIIVKDNWIYYIKEKNGIWKVRTNGKDKKQITTNLAGKMYVINDTIYYTNLDDYKFIYKIKTDGTKGKKLLNYYTDNFFIENDHIYFCNQEHMRQGIYKANLDGTEINKIISVQHKNMIESLTTNDGYIYYVLRHFIDGGSENALVRTDMDGKNVETILNDWIENYIIKDGYIYYKKIDLKGNNNDIIYKLKIGEKEPTKLIKYEGLKYKNFNIVNDDIYFQYENELGIVKNADVINSQINTKHKNFKIIIPKDTNTKEFTIKQKKEKEIKNILNKVITTLNNVTKVTVDEQFHSKLINRLEKKTMTVDQHFKIGVNSSLNNAICEKQTNVKGYDGKKRSENYKYYYDNDKSCLLANQNNRYIYGYEQILCDEDYNNLLYIYSYLYNLYDGLDEFIDDFELKNDKSKDMWVLQGFGNLYKLINNIYNETFDKYDMDEGLLNIYIDKNTSKIKQVEFNVNMQNLSCREEKGYLTIFTGLQTYDYSSDISIPDEVIKNFNGDYKKVSNIMAYKEINTDVMKQLNGFINNDKIYDLYYLRSQIFKENGEYDKALDDIEKYIEYFPNDIRGYIDKSDICYKSYRIDEGILTLNKIIKKFCYRKELYRMLTHLYCEKTDWNNYLKTVNEWISKAPNCNEAILNKIAYYCIIGDYLTCIRSVDEVCPIDDYGKQIDWLIGKVYMIRNEYYLAERRFEFLYNCDNRYKNDISFLQDYFNVLCRLNKHDKCLEVINQILKVSPQSQFAESLRQFITNKENMLSKFIKDNYLYYNEDIKNYINNVKQQKDITFDKVSEHLENIKAEDDYFSFITKIDKDLETLGKSQIEFKTMDDNRSKLYCKINSFYQGVGTTFGDWLADNVSSSQEKTLIIDLRDNLGGSIDEAQYILNMLLPKCVSGTLIDKMGNVTELRSLSYQLKFKNIYILVNENSASASELVTLSLKEYLDNVTVIGKKTFGKGVAQTEFVDEENEYILYLVSNWWNVRQKNIDGIGIIPDINVEGNELENYLKYIN